MFFEVIHMTESKTCKDCAFFIQHYLQYHGKFTWVNCGHCKEPRLKSREPTTKACPRFQEKTPVD